MYAPFGFAQGANWAGSTAGGRYQAASGCQTGVEYPMEEAGVMTAYNFHASICSFCRSTFDSAEVDEGLHASCWKIPWKILLTSMKAEYTSMDIKVTSMETFMAVH